MPCNSYVFHNSYSIRIDYNYVQLATTMHIYTVTYMHIATLVSLDAHMHAYTYVCSYVHT